jgi:hypothetical protein
MAGRAGAAATRLGESTSTDPTRRSARKLLGVGVSDRIGVVSIASQAAAGQ